MKVLESIPIVSKDLTQGTRSFPVYCIALCADSAAGHHHFCYAAPDTGTNFDSAPAGSYPTILFTK
jgi:hypothetical protein